MLGAWKGVAIYGMWWCSGMESPNLPNHFCSKLWIKIFWSDGLKATPNPGLFHYFVRNSHEFWSGTVMYMSLHHSNWITWVVALWLFNVTCFHIQIEAKDLFYMFYMLQNASCTQSGIVVGSLNRVPFWVAGMSHCTTWQERAELSKSLPCSMIGTVIVQKVKIR